MFEKLLLKKSLIVVLAFALFMCSAFACIFYIISSNNTQQSGTEASSYQAPYKTITEGEDSANLNILDFTFNGLSMSYQWYEIEADSNGDEKIDIDDDGTLISSATDAVYETPDTLDIGKYYYYLELKLVADEFDVNLKSDLVIVDIQTQGESSTLSFVDRKMDIYAFDGLSYQWYEIKADSNEDGEIDINDNGTLILDATDAVYETPDTLAVGKYYYYLELTLKNSENLKSNLITVDITTAESKTLTFFKYDKDGIIEYGTLTYQWYQSVENSYATSAISAISGAISNSYTVSSTLANGLYHYNLVLSINISSEIFTPADFKNVNFASNTISVKINPAAYFKVNEGNSVSLNFYFEEATYPWQNEYQWYKNSEAKNTGGVKIEGATMGTYSTPTNLTPGMEHYYYVVLTIGSNQTTSEVFTVKSHAIAKTPVISDQTKSVTISNKSTETVSVTATVSDNGNLTYQWYLDGTAIEGATDSTYEIVGLIDMTGKPHSLYVTVTNSIDNGNGVGTASITSDVIEIIQSGLNINGVIGIILAILAFLAIGSFVTYKVVKKIKASR